MNALLDDPALPFFIQWTVGPAQHPSADAKAPPPSSAARSRATRERSTPGSAGTSRRPIEGSDVHWVEADDPGLVAVHFQTKNGVVRID